MHYRDPRRKRERGRELIKDLLYSTRKSTKYFVMTYMGKESEKGWIYVLKK